MDWLPHVASLFFMISGSSEPRRRGAAPKRPNGIKEFQQMPRRRQSQTSHSEPAEKRIERRLKLVRQWIAAERDLMEFRELAGLRAAKAKANAREGVFEAALDRQDEKDWAELLGED